MWNSTLGPWWQDRAWFDSHHDWLLGEVSMFEAGLSAQEDGYDAVLVDTVSDSGVNALRSVLDIPVIGPGRAMYLMALLLGTRFSVLTQWDPWKVAFEKSLQEYGLMDKCASIRSINIPPDVRNLLGGKEEDVFPKLLETAQRCLDDGADVLCMGSTTMHQAVPFLQENLAVPVINPGPVSYKLVEAVLGLGLTHSRVAYPKPLVLKQSMVHAMLEAAAASEAV